MPYYAVSQHRAPKLTPEQQQLKQALVNTGEEWSVLWQTILARDPAYFAAYVKLRSVALGQRRLSRKQQELIMLAIDASCTHLFEPGMRAHIHAALRAGASKSEIWEVLELTSVLGLHAVNVGVPLLQEALAAKGQPLSTTAGNASPEHRQLHSSLQQPSDAIGGFWATSKDALFALSPDFLEAGTEFASVPFNREKDELDLKTKELIYVAIDCTTSYFRQPALKAHITNALDCGATPEEIMNVFELASLMGGQTIMVGAEILGDPNNKK